MKTECMPKENDTDEDVIRKMCAINGLKCNLHVLVNFAAHVKDTLTSQEVLVLQCTV